MQIVGISRLITTLGTISPPNWLRKQHRLRNQLGGLIVPGPYSGYKATYIHYLYTYK